MPLDRNSPVSSDQGAYTPWDLTTKEGDKVDRPSTFGAAFRTENEVGSLLASEALDLDKREYFRVVDGYNALDDIEGYEDHADRFMESFNPKRTEAIKADIDREKKDRETIEAAGWGGFGASMAASLLSPTTLLPGGAFVRGGRAGFAIGKSARSVGAAAGVGTALQEGALQASQQTRTGLESGLAIGGSVVLGGLLGAAGAKAFTRGDWQKFSKALEEDLADTTPHPSQVSQQIVRKLRSAGAASTDDLENIDWEKELEIGGPRVAKSIAKATAAVRLNPGLELLTSPSLQARRTFLGLAENHVATAGELEGRTLGPAAETSVKRYTGTLATFIAKRRENYEAARKAGFKGDMKDFDLAVAKASRRGDVDPDGNEFVTAASQAFRELDEVMKNEAIGVGIFDENVKVSTAMSHVYRLYNVPKIMASEASSWTGIKFRDILRRHIRGEVDKAIARQEEIEIAKNINRAVDTEEQLTRANERLSSLEDRLAKRRQIRGSKFEAIRRQEGQRFDLLRGRVPESVIAAAKAARDDDVMVRQVAEASQARKITSAKPMQRLLKEKGGVRLNSVLDQELRNMGITPQTAPGLFRRDGGLTAVDNLVAREDELLARFQTDQNGYADPNEILAALRDEMAGAPIRMDDELAAEAARDVVEANAEEWLRQIGLPTNATVKQVREHLNNALKNEAKLSEIDQKIGRMNGDLEEFDKATEKIINERTIATAEAGRYADELNELEAKINEVREFANASPRVKILVDYADARKAYSKGRYEQARIGNRIESLDRVSAEGKMTPELEDELRALRADKNTADERVIKAKAKVEKLKPMLPKDRGEELDFASDMDLDGYVDDIVDNTFNNITGLKSEDVPGWMVPVEQGPLKGRTLNIPDELIEEYLENDMELIARQTVKKMGGDIELTRNFGRADMREQIKAIRDEYKELRAKATSEKEINKLKKKESADVAQIEAFRDMLRGTYRSVEERSNWSAATRLALSWNYIRLLGGVFLSSIPDAANVMTRQGLGSFMSEGFGPMISSTKAARIAKRDAKEWAGIAETVMQTRMAELAELNDPYASGTIADRMMANVTSQFSRLTGLNWWNDTLKTMVTLQTGNKISRLVRKSLDEVPSKWGDGGVQSSFAKLDKGERGYLGKLGIDEGMATRIADQIEQHGVEENGVMGLNLRAWKDKEARRVISAALSKEADGAVITPGIADKPLWARSNPGKLALQFKSFTLAAHQRLLLSRLQGNPKHLAEFLLMGTTLGMMVSYLKYIERGDFEEAEKLTENPGLWVADGLDRTGILTVMMEVSNTLEKVGSPFGIRTAAQMIAGDEDRGADVSRYASRNAYGAFFGPTAGTFSDLVTIFSQAINADVNTEGARAAIRQVPFATLPVIRYGMQEYVKPALQDAVN